METYFGISQTKWKAPVHLPSSGSLQQSGTPCQYDALRTPPKSRRQAKSNSERLWRI